MRWTRDKDWPPNGIMWIERRFLWVPTTALNHHTNKLETRWLEFATVLEEVQYGSQYWVWEPLVWLDTATDIMGARQDNAWQLARAAEWTKVRGEQ